jgi:hypothetical protein
MLSFVAGTVDMSSSYFFQVPMLNDIKAQARNAVCKLMATNVQRNVLINREALPFNKLELRRAVAPTHRSQGLHLNADPGGRRRRAACPAQWHLEHAGRGDAEAGGL